MNGGLTGDGLRERFVIFTKSATDEKPWSWVDIRGAQSEALAELERLREDYPSRKWWLVKQTITEEVLDV